MGIRGTTIIAKVSAVDGTSSLSLDEDPGGGSGVYEIIDTVSNTVLATVTKIGENWIITPTEPGQPPTIITETKTDAELFEDKEALAFVYETYNAARARIGNEPAETATTMGATAYRAPALIQEPTRATRRR